MASLIAVHPHFDCVWPWAADHFHELWRRQGDVDFVRLDHGDERRLGDIVDASEVDGAEVRRLACLGVALDGSCLDRLPALEEATFQGGYSSSLPAERRQQLESAGVQLYTQLSEGFWGQSVAEYGLALTLCALRRIPQLHGRITDSQEPWAYEPPAAGGQPGAYGMANTPRRVPPPGIPRLRDAALVSPGTAGAIPGDPR